MAWPKHKKKNLKFLCINSFLNNNKSIIIIITLSKIIIFSRKRFLIKTIIVTYFYDLSVWLNRRQLNSHSSFYIEFALQYVLFEVHQENPASQDLELEKGRVV